MELKDLVDITDNYWELHRSISNRECIAFVGSGPSSEIYPSWSTLIKRLCEECLEPVPEMLNFATPEDLLAFADKAKESNPEKYLQILIDTFSEKTDSIPQAFISLVRLELPSYITHNFDPFLATAGNDRRYSIFSYPDLPAVHLREKSIFYIHGIVFQGRDTRIEHIILGNKDFERAYGSSTLPSFLTQLFVYHHILFLGCSIGEPQLKNIIQLSNLIRNDAQYYSPNTQKPNMYILLPQSSAPNGERIKEYEEIEDKSYHEIGIKVIRFRQIDSKFSGLNELLSMWCIKRFEISSGFQIGGPNEPR